MHACKKDNLGGSRTDACTAATKCNIWQLDNSGPFECIFVGSLTLETPVHYNSRLSVPVRPTA